MKFRVCRTSRDPLPDGVTKTDDRWGEIEIDTLEKLIEFCQANGEIILSQSIGANNPIHIEIYDDYRE